MRRRRRRSRTKRWLITLTGLIALYALGGFLVAPPLVRSQLVTRLGAALDRDVTIEQLRLNPFACSVTVVGLKIADHNGAELAGWERAYVNFDPLVSLFRWQWQLGEVHLVEPRQRVHIASDGSLNFGDLFPAPAEAPEPPAAEWHLPAAGVSRLLVENWRIEFTDESRRTSFHTVAGPMTFSATDLSTRAENGSPYEFSGATDTGTSFSWSGTLSAVPLGSKGRLELSGFSLPTHMPFAEDFFPGRVTSGAVSFNTEYEVGFAGDPEVRLANASLALNEVKVEAPDNSTGSVALHRMEVTMPAADLMARTADISRIAVDGLIVDGKRSKTGAIDLHALVPASASDTDAAGPLVSTGPAPSIAVAEIALTNSSVTITDETNARIATVELDGITATVRNTGTDLDREVGLEAQLNVKTGGTIAVNGRVRIRPLAAQLDVDIDEIGLSAFDAYVPPPTDIRILRGTVSAQGELEVDQTPTGELALRWSGATAINEFAATDGTRRNELTSWDRLAFSAMQLSLPPLDVSIGEVRWDAPIIRATVTGDGRVNFLEALGRSTEASETTPSETAGADSASAPERSPFTAKIDAVVINDGQIIAQDRSTSPEFNAALREFSGSIRGLSSENSARADVDLHGEWDGTGQLAINGTINPLADDVFTDLDVSLHDIALPKFTAYSSRYLGRKIKTGSLNLDLSYHVSQNVLNGDNRVLLDQFFLGEAVPSDQALNLPIGLALAVLRDREGVIRLPPTPVTGNLDDPQFRIGPVVMHALTNVFLKAATAPFSLLGGMFGAREDQDLSYADFPAGSAELTASAREKLPILAKALFESPALHLVIYSLPYPEIDRPLLRERKFEELLQEEKRLLMLAWSANEGSEQATTPPESESASVAADERNDIIRYAFVRRYPDRAVEVKFDRESPAEPDEPPPASRSPAATTGDPNVVQKILRSIFGGRDPAPAEPANTIPAVESATETPTEPTLTVAEMQEQLRATIEIPDLEFQDLARSRANAIREQLLAAGNVEPERITIAEQPVAPENASRPADAARVFFGLE